MRPQAGYYHISPDGVVNRLGKGEYYRWLETLEEGQGRLVCIEKEAEDFQVVGFVIVGGGWCRVYRWFLGEDMLEDLSDRDLIEFGKMPGSPAFQTSGVNEAAQYRALNWAEEHELEVVRVVFE